MTTPRDPDRLIRAFLADGQTDLPDRTYDAVRSDIERTRQRVVIGPWREPRMNSFAKIAIAAAAVVVVAVVGFTLMPGNGGVGGTGVASPTPAATPTPTPTPKPTPTPTPASTPIGDLPEGPLAGTYTVLMEGVPVSFTVPASGWQNDGSVGTGTYPESDFLGFRFWNTPDNVYADPCAHTPMSPAPDHTIDGLAAAMAAIPGTNLVSGPSSVEIGGQPAQHVVFKIRNDIGCDPETFHLWYDDSSGGAEGGWVWASALGSTHHVWTIDVDGTVLFIDAEYFKGAGPEIEQALQQVIDSITFE